MPIKDFSTFLSKITKYNRVHLGFDPSVARLLGHDPTPQTNLSGVLAKLQSCCDCSVGVARPRL